MPLTRPKSEQINFDVTNLTDPLIRLNSGETGSADKDAGIVIERGDDTNVAILYDESANEFAVVNTSETGTTSGNVTIASYANIKADEFHGDGSNLTGISSSGASITAPNTFDGHTSSAPTIFEGDGAGDEVHVQLKVKANDGSSSTQGIYGVAGSTSTDNSITLGGSGSVGVQVDNNGSVTMGVGASNTVGGTHQIKMGESAFRVMTGGEQHVLCLDRDNNGGTKKIMQSWNPDSGSVAVGNTGPVDAGMLAIKPNSLTQGQLKLMGSNYSYGTELHSQNGSEGGTVGNTRQFFKIEHVTLGSTRTMYTTSSQVGTDTHKWETQNLTRMFLNNTGKLDLYTGTGQWNMACYAGGTGVQHFIDFRLQNNTQVGYINTNGSSVTYSTSSDYRLKENVDYSWDATTRLKQLKPARFNFIADDTNTLVDGFLAHEVSSIVPEAVTGAKDAVTADVLYVEADDLPEGKNIGDVKEASAPDYQGIDQSKLVPLLVKTIQELEARITALEG